MKLPSDVICGVCKKVFCCAECRYKHEIKTHAISVVVQKPKYNEQCVEGHSKATIKFETTNIYLFCSICERKPMPLQREMYAEMLSHVEEYHLPLRCRKCAKVYNRIDDLQNFTKCTQTTMPPSICCYPHDGCYERPDPICHTVTMQKDLVKVTISTQTSPQQRRVEHTNEFHQTPMSLINLRWKTKSKLTHEEVVTDSVSSLKNISSISHGSGRRSLDAIVKPKGQLVRTTSTPVHAELLYQKHTERTFNASGGQVSSIHHSAGDSDNLSPALATGRAATSNAPPPCLSPNRQHLESVNRYLKVGGARAKMTAVTPLRQVMSKSIQKAFAEHGGLPTTTARLNYGTDLQPLSKNKLLDLHTTDASQASPARSPLDLRLSPAVRRTHHEVHTTHWQTTSSHALLEPKSTITQNIRHEVLRSSQRLTTTESIVITRTTQHMTSIEAATESSGVSSDSQSSIASKFSDKSLASSTDNTSYNSALSGSSCGSMYKSCQSVKVISATTELCDIQQDGYAATMDGNAKNVRENIAPTMATVSQMSNSNLPPITPITRIPGALIHKKLICFDSPYEEDELDMEKSTGNKVSVETSNTQELKTPPKHNSANASSKALDKVAKDQLGTNNSDSSAKKKATETPQSNITVSKLVNKISETPLSTNSSATEAFFTPSGTPIRRNAKMRMADKTNKENINKGTSSSCAPSLRKTGRCTTFERSESISDNDNENDEVIHHGTIPKEGGNQNTAAALGRSWSFGAILGSMIRLPSKSKSTLVQKVKTPSPHQSSSLIKRCASLAGTLVRSHSLTDKEEEFRHQKRKRCYTTEGKLLLNAPSEYSHYSDPLSPTTENSLRTKRFRIHGRKPIGRMRRDM
ncbi:mitosis initiation protein fs(1)Ya-like [Eurosta solidaginis]|uniref:mitosis initiation protein fs(1)Ya-like n=1 Tax=Eurosta solidaginis TaxID=178769 RepID=UPI003530D2E8